MPSPGPDQGRDTSAECDAWVDEHGHVLFGYALVRVHDRHVAEDLVQETFLAALEADASYRGESSRRTWLIGILRHKLLDYLRKRHRQAPADAPDPSDPEVDGQFDRAGAWQTPPGDWRADPAALSEQREFWAVFDQCRARLPARLDTAFCLRVIEGLATEEICKALGITATNLWVMLYRARARLRACLETRWFGQTHKEPG